MTDLIPTFPFPLAALVLVSLLMLAVAAFGARRRSGVLTASERHQLHRRLAHSRLERMLRRMHVSPDSYLRRVHPDALREQIDACGSCAHQPRCDRTLACKRNVDEDLSFCPNYEGIAALKRAA